MEETLTCTPTVQLQLCPCLNAWISSEISIAQSTTGRTSAVQLIGDDDDDDCQSIQLLVYKAVEGRGT
ncbi:DEAD/DEAH box helicase [Anopheles sinensis]|uniref:DEAD/DEAH box helicase n=1 Tax=Anopheles sinensis TaxID=74873 RepID=A0A084VFW1_ANOSI|nr:DEAD/DEAH box helicase [Anopheles sinensis]